MRVVFVTCPPGGGEPLLRALLEEHRVACGNIVPGVRSLYWWEGRVCDDPEEILWMETSDEEAPGLMNRIPALHPYKVPKIVMFEPKDVLPVYASWVGEVTGSRPS